MHLYLYLYSTLSTNSDEISERRDRCLTSNKPFDFRLLMRITIQIQEFLTEFLPLRDRSNCDHCIAALDEVCGLRMLPVVNFFVRLQPWLIAANKDYDA